MGTLIITQFTTQMKKDVEVFFSWDVSGMSGCEGDVQVKCDGEKMK